MRRIKAKSAWLPIGGALVISAVLGYAACQKLFYTSSPISNISYVGALVEVLAVFSFLIFYSYWEVWFAGCIIFALWGGFALFAWTHNAPCSCLGEKLALSAGFSLICDALFYLYSVLMVSYLGNNRTKRALLIGLLPFLILLGYLAGKVNLF